MKNKVVALLLSVAFAGTPIVTAACPPPQPIVMYEGETEEDVAARIAEQEKQLALERKEAAEKTSTCLQKKMTSLSKYASKRGWQDISVVYAGGDENPWVAKGKISCRNKNKAAKVSADVYVYWEGGKCKPVVKQWSIRRKVKKGGKKKTWIEKSVAYDSALNSSGGEIKSVKTLLRKYAAYVSK